MGFKEKLRDAEKVLTFNDVILLPGFTTVEPDEPDVSTRVTRRRFLNIPFLSSPMDTVTEAELAIALARTGGLGVIHRNCSIEEQVAMLRAVKRAEAFIIYDVITITPDQTVKEAIELMERHNIHGLPVVDKNEKLVGIITGRDVGFAEHSLKVSDVMSKDVQTADEDITIEKAKEILHAHRIEKLPIVNE